MWTADLRAALRTTREADRWLEVLVPESGRASPRSSVEVLRRGTALTLQIRARDTSAFRAALNTYLRWIELIEATETEAVRRAPARNPVLSGSAPARSA